MVKYIRKDDKAVSPVIAVILMVAITVVLAGVLYVWVTGIHDPGETGLSVTASNPDERSYGWTIEIIEVSGRNFNLNDAKFKMSNANNIRQWTKDKSEPNTQSFKIAESIIYAIPSGNSPPDDGSGNTIGPSTPMEKYYNCSIAFIDNDDNGKINAGDNFYIFKDYDRGSSTDDVLSGYIFELLYKDKMVLRKTL